MIETLKCRTAQKTAPEVSWKKASRYKLMATLCLGLCLTGSAQIAAVRPASAMRSGPPMVRIERSSDHPTTKILMIGQSIMFAYDMPHVFHAIAKSKRPQDSYMIEMVAGGGYGLKDHYEDGTALRELRKERWNYVVIQESTANQIAKGRHQSYETYATFFDQETRKIGAQPLQFECYDDSVIENCPMHLEVLKVATALREQVIPVGTAWRYVSKYYPKIHILSPDYHHPSALGTFLMACVLYSKIYKQPTDGAQVALVYKDESGREVNIDSTSNDDMKTLEKAAWEVVKATP